MKYAFYPACLMLIVLTSCDNSGGGIQREQTLKPLSLPTSTNGTGNPTTSPGLVPATQNPVQSPGLPTPAAPTLVSNPSAPAIGSKINPAHGQPGHRCDVAVGSPIPATAPASNISAIKPAANNNPVATTAPVIQTSTTPAPTTSTTAPGLNPPHGKPGHRCDIAVGQPLNGAPAAKTTTSPIVTTPTLPASPLQTTVSSTAPADGLNPAHGQPGHRCDIAVGKPLSSAPVKN